MIVPFGLLLAAIALGPLVAGNWWLKHYPKVALVLAAVTLTYYLAGLHATERVLHQAHEYISFIALIGSLFVVSGGIHITVKGESTPLENAVFLLIGAVLANLLGTTGASMLLIRPWIRMNKYRITAHHIAFFIFIVSNVGGCLTPIGDPPLFLGYLKGIPFWWVARECWRMWAVGIGLLLLIFYIVDRQNYLRAPQAIRRELAEPRDVWRVQGLWNLAFLGVILGAVFLNDPPLVRESVMLVAALGSYYTTAKPIHQANDFNFHPLEEVAILFIGIFATMMPALDWLQLNAAKMGIATPSLFYWGCGILSSVLDNAPTYLSFLSASMGLFLDPDLIKQLEIAAQSGGAGLAALTGSQAAEIHATLQILQLHHSQQLASGKLGTQEIAVAFLLANHTAFVVAISIGAVFFGANTYIGNGPNFMVKSIADHNKIHTPSFLGFIFRFTLPVMVPVLIVIWWTFFRYAPA